MGKDGIPCLWWNALIPFALLPVIFLPLLFYSGADQHGKVGWDVPVRDIIGNSDSWATLHWTGAFTLTFQIILYAVQYDREWGGCLLWPRETIDAAMNGSMMYFKGTIALLLAFAYAQTLRDLHIAKWLVNGLGDSVSEVQLPSLVFCLCAVFSLATGSSWTTMTVFMSAVVPLAAHIGGFENTELLTSTIAAVLGGSVWGDHCSPVSDTTILSAASSQVPLFEHTKTQLPYAVFTGFMAIIFGLLPAGAGLPAGVCIIMGLILIPTFHFVLSCIPNFGGKVPIYDPKVAKRRDGLRGAYDSWKMLLESSRKFGKAVNVKKEMEGTEVSGVGRDLTDWGDGWGNG